MKDFLYVSTVVIWYYIGHLLIYFIPNLIYLQLYPESETGSFEKLLHGPLFVSMLFFWVLPFLTFTFHRMIGIRESKLFFYFITAISVIISSIITINTIFF